MILKRIVAANGDPRHFCHIIHALGVFSSYTSPLCLKPILF